CRTRTILRQPSASSISCWAMAMAPLRRNRKLSDKYRIRKSSKSLTPPSRFWTCCRNTNRRTNHRTKRALGSLTNQTKVALKDSLHRDERHLVPKANSFSLPLARSARSRAPQALKVHRIHKVRIWKKGEHASIWKEQPRIATY